MNIIEERRWRAWIHAERVILHKVIKAHVNGTLYIYADRIYGKGGYHRLTADYAIDAVFDTVEVLRERWEREHVKPTRELFAKVCPDKAIAVVIANMWRDPFKYWNGSLIARCANKAQAVVETACGR